MDSIKRFGKKLKRTSSLFILNIEDLAYIEVNKLRQKKAAIQIQR